MAMRFNPPPGWPHPPEGFTPDTGWQPDPSWPEPPPGWQLWVPVSTSGMAIAAFVLGLLGFALVSGILGIVLGSVALSQIRRTGQRGKGLAIAGIVLGGGWLAILALAVLGTIISGSSSNTGTSGPVSPGASSRTVNPFSLTAGDCFDNPTATPGQVQKVTSVTQTACDEPHNAQIFATFKVSGSILSYPSDMQSIAANGCADRAAASLDRTKLTSSMAVRELFPLELSWVSGHRTVSCIVYDPTQNVTTSLVNG
jgi:hypothetical protein